ncbi:hypothetical protein O5O45_20555 [Hahella aquimaris]|uniref:hypothetical protein n=1 Tax=Hahella sp. HNIBRBA332 TaxID=3015983 RepID=UPI00273AA252|nr:hypothetical protein [Hahella sp. HNIBRBA332]WLQ12119.1 hypothetical protein O5O45_20555 [Hahella sp. HNIBRBA332]
MQQRDLEFFRPVWRRVAITVFCLFWATLEWATGEPLWGMLASGAALYCYWQLFYAFDANVGANNKENSDAGK